MEKGQLADRVESFEEIDINMDCLRAWPGFAKPIRGGLKKEHNLIYSRSSRAKPARWGERMELDSRKNIRRDRMMRSKSFDTQQVREIDWKKAGESRGFPILWLGIIEDVFQMEGKECKDQERLKVCRRKSMPYRGRCFKME